MSDKNRENLSNIMKSSSINIAQNKILTPVLTEAVCRGYYVITIFI